MAAKNGFGGDRNTIAAYDNRVVTAHNGMATDGNWVATKGNGVVRRSRWVCDRHNAVAKPRNGPNPRATTLQTPQAK